MAEPTEKPEPTKTYDGSINDLGRALINALIKEAQEVGYNGTPLDKIRYHIQHGNVGDTLAGIEALSAYMTARAEERQAVALETLAKTAAKLQVAESVDAGGQAIVDQRESKRDYLATTYSLPTETLSFLWAIRGILVDASIKSLSRPDRFDPYRRVTTEELAWSLRISDQEFLNRLPKRSNGEFDFPLLEEFDILHYGGDDEYPDDWMYGG